MERPSQEAGRGRHSLGSRHCDLCPEGVPANGKAEMFLTEGTGSRPWMTKGTLTVRKERKTPVGRGDRTASRQEDMKEVRGLWAGRRPGAARREEDGGPAGSEPSELQSTTTVLTGSGGKGDGRARMKANVPQRHRSLARAERWVSREHRVDFCPLRVRGSLPARPQEHEVQPPPWTRPCTGGQ